MAYFISGHGENTDRSFIVPPGSTIVMNAKCGEPTLLYRYDDAIDGLCSLPNEVLLNPGDNSAQIVDKIGTVAIYKEGDLCPDIDIELTICTLPSGDKIKAHVPYARLNYSCIFSGRSGLIDLIDYKPKFKHILLKTMDDLRDTTFNLWTKVLDKAGSTLETPITYSDFSSVIAELFSNSVLPTSREVYELLMSDDSFNIVSKFFKDRFGVLESQTVLQSIMFNKSLYSTQGDGLVRKMILDIQQILFTLITSRLSILTDTTLSKLCDKKPGVYYDFICRGSSDLFKFNVNMNANILPIPHRYRRTEYSLYNSNANLRARMKSHIGEAEAHRKTHVKRATNYRSALKNAEEGWITVNRRKTKRGGKRQKMIRN